MTVTRHGRTPHSLTDEDRFWRAVQKTDTCWLFTAQYYQRSGHAGFSVGGRITKAHRYAYACQVGPVPEGLWVLHHCDVPRCVRPDHLYLGTPADNNRDRDQRGRHVALRGEDNGYAKLTETEVYVIRVLLLQGGSQRAIASAFRIHQGTVSAIARRATWAHVGPWPTIARPA